MKTSMQAEAGSYQSPFGLCFLLFDDRKLLSLIFASNEDEAMMDFESRLPLEDIKRNERQAKVLGEMIFMQGKSPEISFSGTDFQIKVWHALMKIPSGATTTYAQIAEMIGKPKAVRAVGTAIGKNPIAYLVPCHRVLRTDGGISGYRWGKELKEKILASEGVIL